MPRCSIRDNETRRVKRILIIFVVALPFIVAIVFLIASNHPAPTPDLPLPNPNGYDQFIKAGGLLRGDAGLYTTMSEEELAALVATNAEALALARSAFTNECRVPVKYSVAYISTHINDSAAFKNLALAMTAEARLAELQDHLSEAAKDYLDVIHLGMESGRGGFMLDAVLGDVLETIGRSDLTNLVYILDAASCRKTTASLEYLDFHRPTWDDVMSQEVRLRHQLAPGLFGYLTMTMFTHKDDTKVRRKFLEKQGKTRSLAVRFAARAYELDKGRSPTNITVLVPAYLKGVPKDSVTGKDLAYPP